MFVPALGSLSSAHEDLYGACAGLREGPRGGALAVSMNEVVFQIFLSDSH